MRTVLSISYILHYCAWVCFYMVIKETDYWVLARMFFSGANVVLLLFYILIGHNDEIYLSQFKTICLLSIMSIFAVLTLNYMGLINGTYAIIKWFCGSVFVASLIVLISGIRHGIFNEE